MESRDKRRWGLADKDKDGKLSREEFSAFLHPETDERMSDIVVTELMEDMDSDKDGVVSLEEYLEDGGWEGEVREGWRKEFMENIDTDKDGVLDRREVQLWVVPTPGEFHQAEAAHLVAGADRCAFENCWKTFSFLRNGDAMLSFVEVQGAATLFLGSQATDFGERIARHSEL